MMSKEELAALEKIAREGTLNDAMNAQRKLGIYYKGDWNQGVNADWLRAMSYFLEAAKAHDFLAMVFIGDMFYHGKAMDHIPCDRGYAYMFYFMATTTDFYSFKNNPYRTKTHDSESEFGLREKIYEARADVDLDERLEEIRKSFTEGQITAFEILAHEFIKNEVFTYTSVG